VRVILVCDDKPRTQDGDDRGYVVTTWYALHGHCVDDVADHRARARWYTTKTEPSYDQGVGKVR
jgi:hypothetical protein